jgi:hypothetical protein
LCEVKPAEVIDLRTAGISTEQGAVLHRDSNESTSIRCLIDDAARVRADALEVGAGGVQGRPR